MNDIPIETESQDIPYLLIHNDILADNRLSYKARGILAYILSRAGKWEVRFRDIVNHSQHDGPAAIRSGLTELVKLGYAALRPHYRPGKKPGTVELAGKRYVILKYVPIPKDTFPEVTVLRTSGNSNFDNPHLRKTITTTRSEEVRTNSKKEELNQEIKIEDYPPTPLPEIPDLFGLAADPPFGEEVAKGRGNYCAHAPGSQTSKPTPNNNSHPKAKRKPSEKKPMTPEAATVLAHLNAVAERDYEVPGKIQERLNAGATVEECLLVIDYIHATWSQEYREKYLNQDSPFRLENFDKNRANAKAWRAKTTRRDSSTPGAHVDEAQASAIVSFVQQRMQRMGS